MIATDVDSTNLLLVGAYRDYEFTRDHSLTGFLDSVLVEDRGLPPPVQLLLKDMTFSIVRLMLSEYFDRSEDDVDELARVVFEKTSGNSFYTIVALQFFESQGILVLQGSVWSWSLDDARRSLGRSNNVVELILSKMEALNRQLKGVLSMSSFLPGTVDPSLLIGLLPRLGYDGGSIEDSLDALVQSHLLQKSSETAVYSFVHDSVKEAAGQLVRGSEEESMRLIVGGYLLSLQSMHVVRGTTREAIRSFSNEDAGKEWMMFAALDHLSQVPLDRVKATVFVELLLQTAIRAADYCYVRGSFGSATQHYSFAVTLLRLDGHRWKRRYALCIRIFLAAMETLFFKGQYESGYEIMQEALTNVSNEDDKVSVYCTLAMARGKMHRNKEAIELLLTAL